MDALYFDDFKPGDRFESAGKTLSESEILDFAFRYDPQPIHMDIGAANDGPYGGLIASGFQTLVVGFRMLWQSGVFNASSLGSPGMDELRWHKPVRPGDTLRAVIEVVETRPSKSKRDRGVCRVKWDVLNQHDEVVLTMTTIQILARRPGTGGDGDTKAEAAP